MTSQRWLSDTQGHRLQFMRSPSWRGTERSLLRKITSQGHSSDCASSDLSTPLTFSPLGEEISKKQPPKIPEPPQLLQSSSLPITEPLPGHCIKL